MVTENGKQQAKKLEAKQGAATERRTSLMEYILNNLPRLTEEQLDEINRLLGEQLL